MSQLKSILSIYNEFVTKSFINPQYETLVNVEGLRFTYIIKFENIRSYGSGSKLKEAKTNAIKEFLKSISEINRYKNTLEKCIPAIHSLRDFLCNSDTTAEQIRELQGSQNDSNGVHSQATLSGISSNDLQSNTSSLKTNDTQISKMASQIASLRVSEPKSDTLSSAQTVALVNEVTALKTDNITEDLIIKDELDMLRNSKQVTDMLKRRGCAPSNHKFDYNQDVHESFRYFQSHYHSVILENIMKSNNYSVDISFESTRETYDLMIKILKEINLEVDTKQVPSTDGSFIVCITVHCKCTVVGMGQGKSLLLAEFDAAADLLRGLYNMLYKNPACAELDKLSLF